MNAEGNGGKKSSVVGQVASVAPLAPAAPSPVAMANPAATVAVTSPLAVIPPAPATPSPVATVVETGSVAAMAPSQAGPAAVDVDLEVSSPVAAMSPAPAAPSPVAIVRSVRVVKPKDEGAEVVEQEDAAMAAVAAEEVETVNLDLPKRLFHCAACLAPLKPPVFRCENEHFMCDACGGDGNGDGGATAVHAGAACSTPTPASWTAWWTPTRCRASTRDTAAPGPSPTTRPPTTRPGARTRPATASTAGSWARRRSCCATSRRRPASTRGPWRRSSTRCPSRSSCRRRRRTSATCWWQRTAACSSWPWAPAGTREAAAPSASCASGATPTRTRTPSPCTRACSGWTVLRRPSAIHSGAASRFKRPWRAAPSPAPSTWSRAGSTPMSTPTCCTESPAPARFICGQRGDLEPWFHRTYAPRHTNLDSRTACQFHPTLHVMHCLTCKTSLVISF